MLGALAVGAAVAGCGYLAASPSAPATTPAPTTPGTTSGGTGNTPGTPTVLPRQDVVAGSDGLTVRYADRDGSLKTLRVEDFPR